MDERTFSEKPSPEPIDVTRVCGPKVTWVGDAAESAWNVRVPTLDGALMAFVMSLPTETTTPTLPEEYTGPSTTLGNVVASVWKTGVVPRGPSLAES